MADALNAFVPGQAGGTGQAIAAPSPDTRRSRSASSRLRSAYSAASHSVCVHQSGAAQRSVSHDALPMWSGWK